MRKFPTSISSHTLLGLVSHFDGTVLSFCVRRNNMQFFFRILYTSMIILLIVIITVIIILTFPFDFEVSRNINNLSF